MAFINSLKLSGVIAAGTLALGLAAPAHASSVTFQIDYAGSSTLNVDTANLLATATYQGTVTGVLDGVSGTYAEYTIDSITGTRTTTPDNGGTPTTSIVSDYTGTTFDYTDNIYINLVTGLTALDTFGIAFDSSDGSDYDVRYFSYTDSHGVVHYGYEVDGVTYPYVESGSLGQDAGLAITIREVPAPTALALLGVSLIGMGMVRRRKKA